jgi:hypothetical protein
MSATRATESVKSRIETVIALARLLERVEAKPTSVGADQYQSLVRQVKLALDADLPEDALQAVLGAHPAAAELYENMHYAHSGLSRQSLERSVQSEMLTSQLLARVAKATPRN